MIARSLGGIALGTGLAGLIDYLGVLDGPGGYGTMEHSLFFDAALGSGFYAGVSGNTGNSLVGLLFASLPELYNLAARAFGGTQHHELFASAELGSILTKLMAAAGAYVVGFGLRSVHRRYRCHED